jgi:hypothetical protein
MNSARSGAGTNSTNASRWRGSVEISASAIHLVPEAIARENLVLPLGRADFRGANDLLVLAVPNPYDFDLIWLNSILNRNIAAVAANPVQLFQTINRRYRHPV